jgi:hypothetical protein
MPVLRKGRRARPIRRHRSGAARRQDEGREQCRAAVRRVRVRVVPGRYHVLARAVRTRQELLESPAANITLDAVVALLAGGVPGRALTQPNHQLRSRARVRWTARSGVARRVERDQRGLSHGVSPPGRCATASWLPPASNDPSWSVPPIVARARTCRRTSRGGLAPPASSAAAWCLSYLASQICSCKRLIA